MHQSDLEKLRKKTNLLNSYGLNLKLQVMVFLGTRGKKKKNPVRRGLKEVR